MIVRTWSARASAEGAEAYREYFADTLLHQLRRLPGFEGAYLLRRSGEPVVLTALTFWAGEDAIRAFTGPDIGVSVVEPEGRRHLLDIDEHATHATVLVDARG